MRDEIIKSFVYVGSRPYYFRPNSLMDELLRGRVFEGSLHQDGKNMTAEVDGAYYTVLVEHTEPEKDLDNRRIKYV
jgi:hypothetical protein